MENFTPVSSFAGGLLIGLSATLLLWWNGRIAGISGILGGLVTPGADDRAWRALFVAGLVLGAFATDRLWGPVDVTLVAPLPVLVIAGLLVGYGTRLGSGCTSGHGVCGIARFSKRSLVATMTFMLVAGLTVFVTRHVLGAGG